MEAGRRHLQDEPAVDKHCAQACNACIKDTSQGCAAEAIVYPVEALSGSTVTCMARAIKPGIILQVGYGLGLPRQAVNISMQ